MTEGFFDKVVHHQFCNFIKKRLQHRNCAEVPSHDIVGSTFERRIFTFSEHYLVFDISKPLLDSYKS